MTSPREWHHSVKPIRMPSINGCSEVESCFKEDFRRFMWIAKSICSTCPGTFISIRYAPASYHTLRCGSFPARVQIWWEGSTFAREPLPAWRLKHLPRELPASFHSEALAAKGRAAVERFGCGRCHRDAFPAAADSAPGPSLDRVAERVDRNWLVAWLDNPAQYRSVASMPVLFASDRSGLVERWLIADYLMNQAEQDKGADRTVTRDHRPGKQAFIGVGCVACHPVPDAEFTNQHRRSAIALLPLWNTTRGPGSI
jgi:cytochrome c551/c552